MAVAYRLVQYAVRDLYRRGLARGEDLQLDEAAGEAEAAAFDVHVVDALEDECRRALLPTCPTTWCSEPSTPPSPIRCG